MTELPCKSCSVSCSLFYESHYNMRWWFAVAENQPTPICDAYKESCYHGIEGVRP